MFISCDQFGRGDHGRLGYGRKVTTGQPLELPVDIPPPEGQFNHADEEEDGTWIAKFVACGGRHTLAIMEGSWIKRKQNNHVRRLERSIML